MKESLGRNKVIGQQKTISLCEDRKESLEDKQAIEQGVAKANRVKYKETAEITHDHSNIDKEMKVRENASELLVITKTKNSQRM